MRRILVTGSDGQVGHELLKTLAPFGQLIAVTRQDADLADGAALQALLQRHDPDVVVNPAAYTAVDRAESDAGTAFAVNATAPAVLAEWAERHQRVLIHYSTDYVYAGEGEAAQAEHASQRRAPFRPLACWAARRRHRGGALMSRTVRNVPERSRYELVDGDEVLGFADYRERGDDLEFPHTVIDPSQRGRGLGALLVRGALDDVRAQGRKVIPTCWFVAEFIGLHNDYKDVLAEPKG